MRIRHIIAVLLPLLVTLPAGAQEATPAVPGAVTPQVVTATPGPDDPRLNICTAPTLDGFVPHIIRPGERLADLLTGVPNISVTQLAALNCLDDPAALPVGAVVWVPAAGSSMALIGEADSEPEIMNFEASDLAVQNQGEITFTWEAQGAKAYFYACPGDPNSECRRPPLAMNVPLTGEITISNFRYAGLKRFRLEVRGAGDTVTEDITIEVTCSQRWLGPVTGFSACPQSPPLAVFAAWQPFEGGIMLWFSDTREIWVMTNADHRVQVFPDTFVEGEPDPLITAPEDRYTPVRGFGRVWAALGGEDSPLGWALAEETGFDSARQPVGSRSYTTFIQGPGDTVYAVTLIPQIGVGLWTPVAG
ncbi:MAG TPA: hypothetical protein VKY59_19720 [Spirillospora sp.]|nr:hypothetical protein [Spirillospora sp.]